MTIINAGRRIPGPATTHMTAPTTGLTNSALVIAKEPSRLMSDEVRPAVSNSGVPKAPRRTPMAAASSVSSSAI